jgi:hypothetical protein
LTLLLSASYLANAVAHTPVAIIKLRTLKLVHLLPFPFAKVPSRLPAFEPFHLHCPFEMSIPDGVEAPNFLARSLAVAVGTHFADLMQTDIVETRLLVRSDPICSLLHIHPCKSPDVSCENPAQGRGLAHIG